MNAHRSNGRQSFLFVGAYHVPGPNSGIHGLIGYKPFTNNNKFEALGFLFVFFFFQNTSMCEFYDIGKKKEKDRSLKSVKY